VIDQQKHTSPTQARSVLTAAERDAIFASRAAELAASAPGEAPGDTFEALVFAVGGEQYALPGPQVREVRPLPPLTSLSGTPSFIAGLINVRGRIVPVIDLRPLVGAPLGDGPGLSVVLVPYRDADVGILATERPTVRVLRTADLTEPPAGAASGLDPACVRGIAPGLVLVLDAERLLADPRHLVQHDVLQKV
jgi:purine-binding chemotaxis protein CheW